jgi:quercetin dioxygenase-like cupin family protein
MTIFISPKHNFNYNSTGINVYHANKGEGLPSHIHSYTHITMCDNGSCLVSLEGRSYTIDKNSKPLFLPANEWHEIEALEDETVFVNVIPQGEY